MNNRDWLQAVQIGEIIEEECLHSSSYFFAYLLGASPRTSDFVASSRSGCSDIS